MSTPTFPLDPPGIDAAGNSKIVFVQALADPSAPTVAELAAGTDLSCALYRFVPTGDQTTVSRAKYCYKQAVETFGRETWAIEAIEYDYDPQNLTAPEYAYYAALQPGISGYIVDRRGLDARTEDWAAAQIVDVYPVRLGIRDRLPIDPTAEGETLRTRQRIAVVGDVLQDVSVAAGA